MEAATEAPDRELTPEEALLAADLEDWLADEEYVPTLEVPTGDSARDELAKLAHQDHANVLLYRIAKATRELRRIEQLASAQRQRIDSWADDRSSGPRYVIADAERQLEAIARQLVGPKETGFSVPNGRVTLRKPSERLVVEDEDAALEYLQEKIADETLPPDVIRTKVEPSVSSLKAIAVAPTYTVDGEQETAPVVIDAETGEAIPGVRWARDASRRFEYKSAKP